MESPSNDHGDQTVFIEGKDDMSVYIDENDNKDSNEGNYNDKGNKSEKFKGN